MALDQDNHYDYLFVGGGCAAMSLLARMANDEVLRHKKILLIEPDAKNKNDRTWSYWETGEGFFEEIVYKKWNRIQLGYKGKLVEREIKPYTYKTIRGIDFYNHCLSEMASLSNFSWERTRCDELVKKEDKYFVRIGAQSFTAETIFNSINLHPFSNQTKQNYFLWQHFLGYFIETNEDSFDEDCATWMDFNVPQIGGTCFMYLLPFTKRKALVEFTSFSAELLHPEIYKAQNEAYLSKLGIKDYEIKELEHDKIPMTDFEFVRQDDNLINIGTAGGATRASTGFTFTNIQRQADLLFKRMRTHNLYYNYSANEKIHAKLDKTLLHLLQNKILGGDDIFGNLFEKNKIALLLKFLNGDTNVLQTLRVMNSVQIIKFTKAFFASGL
jgi:lycopene beta-cyclase